MKTSFKQLVAMFASFFAVQAVILYLVAMLFPDFVVLGTHLYSPLQGLLQSMFVLTLIMVGATPIIETLSEQYKFKLKDMHWMVLYFLINTAAIWLVARFAEQLGFGISSFLVAVSLGLVFDIVQGFLMVKLVSKVK